MTTPTTLRTVKQAAEQLQVSRGTIYALFRRGELRRVKVGQGTRIRLWDLERFIERRCVK